MTKIDAFLIIRKVIIRKLIIKGVYLLESLHYLLMKSYAQLTRKVLLEAAKLDLTPGQPKILEFLWQYTESDQKTIANYCEIEQTTVGRILTRMEQSGLVVRRQHPGNRRSLFVSLTDKGRDAASKMLDIFQKMDAMALDALTEKEQEQLKQLLQKVSFQLSAQSERGKSNE